MEGRRETQRKSFKIAAGFNSAEIKAALCCFCSAVAQKCLETHFSQCRVRRGRCWNYGVEMWVAFLKGWGWGGCCELSKGGNRSKCASKGVR